MSSVMILQVFFALSFCAMHAESAPDPVTCSAESKMIDDRQFFQDYEACMFPSEKLNYDCVVNSCPKLSTSGVCPFNSEGHVDPPQFNKGLDIVTQCLRNSTSICDVPTTTYDMPAGWTKLVYSERTHGYLTMGPDSQISVPWQRNDFFITAMLGDRTGYYLKLQYNLIYRMHVSGYFEFSYNRIIGEPGNYKDRLTTQYSNLSINLTNHRQNIFQMFYETDLSKPKADLYHGRLNLEYDMGSMIAVGRFNDPKLTKEMNEDIDNNLRNNDFRDMNTDFKLQYLFPKFVGTYVAYAIQEMDKACQKKV